MKKTIISMALASILCFGATSAFAQSAGQGQESAKKECCKKEGKKCDKKDGKKCDKKEGKCGKQEGRKGECKGEKKCINPFEGLNLTESQKTAVEAIPTPRQVMKAVKEQQKEGSKVENGQSREERMAVVRNVFTDYLSKVKAVLTPEQYVQFLENSYVSNSMMKKDGHKNGRMDGRKKDGKKDFKKGERKDGKGQRPDKKK